MMTTKNGDELNQSPVDTWEKVRQEMALHQVSSYTASGEPPVSQEQTRWMKGVYDNHTWATKQSVFLSIARFMVTNRPMQGYYFEFGGYGARTMRLAFDSFRYIADLRYVEFDSFRGLPEVSGGDLQGANWLEGQMAMSEVDFRNSCIEFGMPEDRLMTVAGYYDNSLTPALAASLLPTKAAVIFIDCDLFTSARAALAFLPQFLQPGTIIVFDDWYLFFGDPERGERRAWEEFKELYPRARFIPFVSTHDAQSFIFLGWRE